jgi:malonyl CoA-acyl carrier protein transacylase/phosphopantetheinyl transferase
MTIMARANCGIAWDTELCLFGGESRDGLVTRLREVDRTFDTLQSWALSDAARTLGTGVVESPHRLAIVATSTEDLRKKIAFALRRLSNPACTAVNEIAGIYYFAEPLGRTGKVAFLYPGEGSQYPNMLADLCVHFPEVRNAFDVVDRAFVDHERGFLPSDIIFPVANGHSTATSEERGGETAYGDAGQALWQMDVGTEAVFAASQALTEVLLRLKIRGDFILGHSTGEYSALLAAGAVRMGSVEELVQHIRRVNQIYEQQARLGCIPLGVLLAVGGVELATVQAIVDADPQHLHLAMDNCPHQLVLFGDELSIARAAQQLKAHGALCSRLPFDRAYHTPLFAPVCEPLVGFMDQLDVVSPKIVLYSCCSTGPYPVDPPEIRKLAVAQWAQPVRFRETIGRMYDAGARIFIEVGPRGNLTGFVADTLHGKPHLAVSLNVPHRTGIAQLQHALGLLAAHGVSMDLGYLRVRGGWGSADCNAQNRAPDIESAHVFVNLQVALPELRLGTERDMAGEAGSRNRMDAVRDDASNIALALEAITAQLGSDAGVPLPQDARCDVITTAHPAMVEYLHTMEQFLQSQQRIMTAFLALPSATALGAIAAPTKDSVVPFAGPHVTATPCGPISRVRTPATNATTTPQSDRTRQLVVSGASDAERAEMCFPRTQPDQELLLRLVSDKTGYPLEMLGLDVGLETDLGVNSIMRIEILGALQRQCGRPTGEELERVSRARTLREILDQLTTVTTKIAPDVAAAGREMACDACPAAQVKPPSPMRPHDASPFIGTVMAQLHGEEVLTVRTFRTKHDQFIHDHTLGGRISEFDPSLKALPVMPFSMTMEMMAEVAALLEPGRMIATMKNVQATGWIVLDRQETSLQVRARRTGRRPSTIEVQVRLLDGATTPSTTDIPVVQGVVEFADADHVPETVDAREFQLRAEHASTWTPESLYTEGMFNGPSFRGVATMDRCGEDGAVATLKGLPADCLVPAVPHPELLVDPIVVDAAGQVVGFWAAEHLDRGFVIFPCEVRELTILGPRLPVGAMEQCRVRVTSVTERVIESDIEVVDANGMLNMRLTGWRDKRCGVSREFASFVLSPARITLSEPYAQAFTGCCAADEFECRIVRGLSDILRESGSIWQQVLAHLILGRAERDAWLDLAGPRTRREAWLLGRLAVKDAVRLWIKRKHDLTLLPADIEIEQDTHGRPTASGAWTKHVPVVPSISIAHADDMAIAVAGHVDGCRGIGIDIELLGKPRNGYQRLAFTPRECALLSELVQRGNEEWDLRLWCAKEAVAKALGLGLLGGPQNLVAQEIAMSGEVRLAIYGELRECLPMTLDGASAMTTKGAGWVTAIAILTT